MRLRDVEDQARETELGFLRQQEESVLRRQAAEYQAWEDWEVQAAMARSNREEVQPRRKRCVVDIEIASGSGDQPRTTRRHVFTVPDEGRLEIRVGAAMVVDVPESEVSTMAILPDEGEQDAGDLDFQEFELFYQQWRVGSLTSEEVMRRWGQTVLDMMDAQYAAQLIEDAEMGHAGCSPGVPTPPGDAGSRRRDLGHLGGHGLSGAHAVPALVVAPTSGDRVCAGQDASEATVQQQGHTEGEVERYPTLQGANGRGSVEVSLEQQELDAVGVEQCSTSQAPDGRAENSEDREVVDLSVLPGDGVVPWSEMAQVSPAVSPKIRSNVSTTPVPQAVLMHPRSLKRRRAPIEPPRCIELRPCLPAMHPRSLADERRRIASQTTPVRETSPRAPLRPARQEATTIRNYGLSGHTATHSSLRGSISSTLQPSRPRHAYAPPARETNTRGSRISNRVKAQNPVVCFLCDIGLPQYVDAMLRNGFDDIETLSDMREEHMKSMGMLPGHALKLKKRLREFLGTQGDEVSPVPSRPKDPEPFSVDALSNDATLSIQQSWVEVRKLGQSTVGHTFYKHMFQLVPEARKLFPMTFQRHFGEEGLFQLNFAQAVERPPAPVLEHFTRVLEAIGTAVAGLQNKERLVPQLNALGYRHATLGLEEKYFRVGNAALMLTLHEALGSRFTTSLEDRIFCGLDWRKLLDSYYVSWRESSEVSQQESWTLVYGFMSANMITGFREFRAKEAQVGEFRADLQRSLKKEEDASKDKKKEAIPQPEKMRALAEKISGHLKKEDKPTLLTSQPKEPEISQKVDVSEDSAAWGDRCLEKRGGIPPSARLQSCQQSTVWWILRCNGAGAGMQQPILCKAKGQLCAILSSSRRVHYAEPAPDGSSELFGCF
eukprot:s422_g7.t3